MGADVIANLHSGLGNQLFQVAAALHARRAIGASASSVLFLCESRDSLRVDGLPGLDIRIPTRGDRARWVEFATDRSPLTVVFRPTARAHERLTKRMLIRQSSPFEEAPVLQPGRPVKLHGYFQNPSWFEDSWQEVVDLLLRTAPDGFEELRACRKSVIHVRRGDYTQLKWDLGPAYYRNSMSVPDSGRVEVVLVCDEPGFAAWFGAAVQPAGVRVAESTVLTGDPAIDDFWNIAAASSITMANSTYSWWASAVASSLDPTTTVTYPQPWLVNCWNDKPAPNLGLPGWKPFPSGLPEPD